MAFSSLSPHLQALLPAKAQVGQRERLRAGTGALLGIVLTGLLSAAWLQSDTATVWLMAPMGASAVLLFGVPASPLAQPWSVVGGNFVAAVIGVSCAKVIPSPELAAGAAIFLSIGAMFALRCLHPPSGAVALTAVLGGPGIHALGYGFVLAPVGINSVLLMLFAIVYNHATGRRYPHSQRLESSHPHQTRDLVPTARLGFTPDDLHAVLKQYGQVLDVSADDLESLFHQTEKLAFRRRFGDTVCGDIMSRDVLSADYATELGEAWRRMDAHTLQVLPVIDRSRRVIGMVTRSDFLQHANLTDYRSAGERMRQLLKRVTSSHSDRPEVVGQIMRTPVPTLTVSTPIVDLVELMADGGHHHIAIVDDERRLAGIVTQTDLVGALYETGLAGAAT